MIRDERIAREYIGGLSMRAVGRLHGITGERVRQILREIGVEPRPKGGSCGPRAPRVSLRCRGCHKMFVVTKPTAKRRVYCSPDCYHPWIDWAGVSRRLARGMTYAEAGKPYGVSAGHIAVYLNKHPVVKRRLRLPARTSRV